MLLRCLRACAAATGCWCTALRGTASACRHCELRFRCGVLRVLCVPVCWPLLGCSGAWDTATMRPRRPCQHPTAANADSAAPPRAPAPLCCSCATLAATCLARFAPRRGALRRASSALASALSSSSHHTRCVCVRACAYLCACVCVCASRSRVIPSLHDPTAPRFQPHANKHTHHNHHGRSDRSCGPGSCAPRSKTTFSCMHSQTRWASAAWARLRCGWTASCCTAAVAAAARLAARV